MIVIPIYDLLMLPAVTFFFKKEILPEKNITSEQSGEDILFLMQKTEKEREELTPEDFFSVGITGKIESIDEEGNVRIRTREKVDVSDVEVTEEEIHACGIIRPEISDLSEEEGKERFDKVKKDLMRFVQGFPWGMWARSFIFHWKSFGEVACALSSYLNITWEEKYQILETDSRRQQCDMIEEAVYELMEVFRVGEEAENVQQERQEKLYRESALRKQIDILQNQLDEMHPENISDVRRFETRIKESGMNEEAQKEAEKVLNRMKQEGKDGHEYGLLYDYLDFVTSLSWKCEENVNIDLEEAEKILDEDHFGLQKVKERIIQQIAVMALNNRQSGSILLFVGAPGTGKTSIGRSIARALHRSYVRISLGGIRDEAEIRGHRRTYVGAMPGRIMEGMKRSGVQNPVMVLDEVDKLTRDYGGDPSSALLEVLDPEQNNTFTDHYMNIPYDLSNVFFVCTANTTETIPEPLLNRMEVIQFSGYTPVEKFHIGKKHLLPGAMKSMGISPSCLKVTDGAMRRIIEEYTSEAGVRGLKKQMNVLCRAAAVKLVKGEQKSISVSEKRVGEFLGNNCLHHEKILGKAVVGVVTGLAWTTDGGEILFVETSFTRGSGEIILTGQLGDVMKESAQIAITLVKSLFPEQSEKFAENDLHIHVPSGAVPKDGPSAGITLVTALASLVTGNVVSRELAMTGEVSLRGGVMPVGGLPEKLMAAQRAGVKRVLVPFENEKDLEEVAEEVKEKLEIIPVKTVAEVLKMTLSGKK